MPFADAANRLLVRNLSLATGRAAGPAKTLSGVPRNIFNVLALFKARVEVRRWALNFDLVGFF
jgi:hypothetical protein